MSYTVTCDKCGENVDIRGYSGHLRMAHGVTGDEMRDLVEMKKAYVTESDGGKPQKQETTGYSHAAQVSADAQSDESDEHACTMCGRSDSVRDSEEVAKLFSQRGYKVPEELTRYTHYCADCEYAFGGENDE